MHLWDMVGPPLVVLLCLADRPEIQLDVAAKCRPVLRCEWTQVFFVLLL